MYRYNHELVRQRRLLDRHRHYNIGATDVPTLQNEDNNKAESCLNSCLRPRRFVSLEYLSTRVKFARSMLTYSLIVSPLQVLSEYRL